MPRTLFSAPGQTRIGLVTVERKTESWTPYRCSASEELIGRGIEEAHQLGVGTVGGSVDCGGCGSIGPVVVGFEIGTRVDESRSGWCDFARVNRKACREGAGDRRAREARRNGAGVHPRAQSGQGWRGAGRVLGERRMERRCVGAGDVAAQAFEGVPFMGFAHGADPRLHHSGGRGGRIPRAGRCRGRRAVGWSRRCETLSMDPFHTPGSRSGAAWV